MSMETKYIINNEECTLCEAYDDIRIFKTKSNQDIVYIVKNEDMVLCSITSESQNEKLVVYDE